MLSRLKPELTLRLGLGLMYVYSGLDLFIHPARWEWAVEKLPPVLQNIISALGVDNFLKIQGAAELILAAVFIVWFLPRRFVKWAALISTLELLVISLFTIFDYSALGSAFSAAGGQFLENFLGAISGVTFRDLGVLGASAALYLIYARRY